MKSDKSINQTDNMKFDDLLALGIQVFSTINLGNMQNMANNNLQKKGSIPKGP